MNKIPQSSYSAALSGSADIAPDDMVPTASGDNIKSGYGIKETATASLSVNAPTSHYAPAQTGVSYFPEFDYKNYWRLLTCSGGLNAAFQLQPNEYSTYTRPVHFTPDYRLKDNSIRQLFQMSKGENDHETITTLANLYFKKQIMFDTM